MGEIVDFRRRGADTTDSPQSSRSRPDIIDQTRIPREVIDAFDDDLTAAQVVIPSWQDLFDETQVTFKTTPVATYREEIDITTPEGVNLMIDLENALLVARGLFVESANMPVIIRIMTLIKIGKNTYSIGVLHQWTELEDAGRDLLIRAVGPIIADKIIQELQTAR